MNSPVILITVLIFLRLLLAANFYEKVPNLIKVRRQEDAMEAEYIALDFIGLIEKHGRKAEAHNVTTEDGYILSLFRIQPNSEIAKNSGKNPVVFLVHGFAASSDIFVVFGPGKSLACILSDAGYDVWAGNFRGNTYSRSHKFLSPEDKEFWNFSIDELGMMDLPAMLDYILDVTGERTLTYVGHSLGSTALLMLLATKPEYNDKLNLAIHLAPVAYWMTKSPLRIIIPAIGKVIQNLYDPTGQTEVFPQSSVFASLFNVCDMNNIMELCLLPLELLLDAAQVDKSLIILAATYYPAGSSAKILYHYRQHAQSSKFRRYDYENEELNNEHYGQSKPPDYNLHNVRVPTVIFHAQNDLLSTAADTKALISHLPRNISITYEVIKLRNFNHLDFITATDVKRLVYDRLMEILNRFHRNKFHNSSKRIA